MRAMLILPLLFLSALPQRAVEPIRVRVVGGDDAATVELADDVRRELRKVRDVVITDARPDFELYLAAMPVHGDCGGYAVATLTVRRADRMHGLKVSTGAELGAIAALIVEEMDKEQFAPLRGGAFSRRR